MILRNVRLSIRRFGPPSLILLRRASAVMASQTRHDEHSLEDVLFAVNVFNQTSMPVAEGLLVASLAKPSCVDQLGILMSAVSISCRAVHQSNDVVCMAHRDMCLC